MVNNIVKHENIPSKGTIPYYFLKIRNKPTKDLDTKQSVIQQNPITSKKGTIPYYFRTSIN